MDERNDSITLRKDAYIFEHGDNISVFKKYQDTCGRGLAYKIMLIITTPACNKMSRPFVSYKKKKLF